MNKTVLVLGAGASVPFGFPSGQTLKDRICKSTLKQAEFIDILKEFDFGENKIRDFRVALMESGRPSVDAFLEYRDDFVDIGKASIALALKPLEMNEYLFSDWMRKRANPNNKEGNWYDFLFGELADGVPFEKFDENKLSIVTFNYDRSIEHYLFTALKNSYNKTDEECAEKLQKIEIVHVHGSLGPLDWQLRPNDLPSVPYEPILTSKHIKQSAENIKIIRETVGDTPEFTIAHKLIKDARQVLFLGFGYHPNNLKRLKISSLPSNIKYIQGTSLGLPYTRIRTALDVIQSASIYSSQGEFLFPMDVYTFLHDKVLLGSW